MERGRPVRCGQDARAPYTKTSGPNEFKYSIIFYKKRLKLLEKVDLD
jgi:hypothetical protein